MILLTGASGFVGSHVAEALPGEVRCLVRRPEAAGAVTARCEVVRGDVTDTESLRRAVEGCEAVVHLVAIIAGRPEDFDRVMVEGTRNLLDAAQDAGVRRWVQMSALGVNERSKDVVPYYRAKWAIEEAVRDSSLEWTIFRPSFIFARDGGILPMFARQARWSPVIPVPGDGTRRLQPIWIDDVATSFGRALERPEAAGRVIELGGPDALTWNDLYLRLARALGKQRRLVHIPFAVARAGAAAAERLPSPPVTRDQLTMLELEDNVTDDRSVTELLGVEPIGVDEQLRRAVAA